LGIIIPACWPNDVYLDPDKIGKLSYPVPNNIGFAKGFEAHPRTFDTLRATVSGS
jgi:hypothetical protein